ncbi:NPCBM/NEW2 domain-containing protein [Aeoliella mucimassa]|uniref:NPCBM/NEW2 domain protein n=1 Tax=Aeoliella mucimassa TaxID=2527972 RepID=A0A518AMU6_9BACT|nr:NPCBM/NEW2 domain-containing protein [Aeoliella mucimassa]QDU56057.1 NPCBM/NEW2 domain protein [Aeoliella mucimassa]
MLYLFTCILLASTAAVDVRITTVDDTTVQGAVQTWDDQSIALDTSAGESTELPLDKVLRVDIGSTPSATDQPLGAVHLTDGSSLAVRDLTIADGQCVANAPALATDDQSTTSLPLRSVRSIRLMPLDAAVPGLGKEWRDLQQSDAAGDLIVIRKPEATNLNYVEGTLGDVTAEAVQFTLDADTLNVARTKVFGLVYYRGPASDEAAPSRVLVTGPGLRLSAKSARVEGDQVVVQSHLLGELRLPLQSVSTIDYSIDRVQYLSDLEPVQLAWQPTALTSPVATLLGGMVRDRGFYSSALEIEFPTDSLPADEVSSSGLPERITFSKGLAVRSKSELAFRVPKGFSYFRATVGIDPETAATGEVQLTVQGDSKVLFEQAIRGGEAPVELECKVSGIRELKLLVDYGSRGPTAGTGDNLNLGAARFTK